MVGQTRTTRPAKKTRMIQAANLVFCQDGGVFSTEEYKSISDIVSAYRSVSLHDLDLASVLLLSPMPRASTPEEPLTIFHDNLVPEDDTRVVFSIVPEESSMHALLAAFQYVLTSSGPDTLPQVSVHSAHAHSFNFCTKAKAFLA
jgi:hypothetical protein